ncbi:PilZ domain-containing protein [Thalassovita taeanensis]|uniref:PilZ domain-containing protein n=1 Tax=Thalassovita taeanensis TaxID=657014 RepID=A0A1H9HR18_9RHOB|nr:PilZ domain-containing protein [Thalassovita taeanensis]SEQ64726.1 PilZ domain-containing protein [Thalassovita taeanensis]
MKRYPQIFLVTCLIAFWGNRALSEAPCQINTWLATLYYNGTALSGQLSGPLDTEQVALITARHADRYSLLDVRLKLRDSGMSGDAAEISQFLTTQNLVLSALNRGGPQYARSVAQNAGLASQLAALQNIVSRMRCNEDEEWRARAYAQVPGGAIPLSRLGAILTALGVSAGCVGYVLSKRFYLKQRRSRRFVCAVPCQVEQDGLIYDAEIIDLSQLGAKLRLHIPLHAGHKMMVRIKNRPYPAHLTWQNANFAGLSFAHHLDSDLIQSVVRPSPANRISKTENGARKAPFSKKISE